MAFLGVHKSITGRKWIGPNDEQHRRAEAISQITGQKPPVASVLARLEPTNPAPPVIKIFLSYKFLIFHF